MKTRHAAAILAALLLARPAAAALPTSQSTTYVANSPPAIKAQDLNDLQVFLAGIYSALFSVKALVVDGTGGNSVAGTAGTVKVSAAVSAYTTTAPFAMPSVPVGQLAREQVILGAVHCTLNPITTVIVSCGGFNVRSVEYTGASSYTVTLNTSFPNLNRHVATVTTSDAPSTYAVIPNLGSSSIDMGGYKVGIRFIDYQNHGNIPFEFNLIVVGG